MVMGWMLGLCLQLTAQDSLLKRATTSQLDQRTGDSALAAVKPVAWKSASYPSYQQILREHPYFQFESTRKQYLPRIRPASHGTEPLFYVLTALLLTLGILRGFFGRYLQNLVKVFFRASLKQRQMREQLLQSPLPSLLLNVFFVTVLALMLALMADYYRWLPAYTIWQLFAYSWLAVALIYGAKFLILKFMGWVFQMKGATDTYIFILFLVNKLLSISILPFLVLISFGLASHRPVWVTLTWVLVGAGLVYRYVASFAPVQREIKLSPLHFFLYLCAFEIAPVWVLYKVLSSFLERSV